MYTKSQLYAQLEEMNAPNSKGSVVMLHSSLRAVGKTEGRGEGLLEVLIDYFTANGGLLCIPTHTWAFSQEPVSLDLSSDKTCVGMLTSIAARHPLAHRSHHPTHSVAVFGDSDAAEEYIAFDSVSDTPTHPRGCNGKLYERAGYVMLVGVGHDKNTYLHSVEEMMDVPNRLTKDKLIKKVKLTDGSIVERAVHCHYADGIGDVSARYPKYEAAFRYFGHITDGMLGDARVQLCDCRGMKEVLELIRKNSGGAEILQDFEPLDESLYK